MSVNTNIEEIDGWVALEEEALEELVRQSVTDIVDVLMRRFVEDSPVRTGRFRGSWTVTINTPNANALPPAPADGTAQGQLEFFSTDQVNAGRITMGRFKIGDVAFVLNCTPYAQDLAFGSSPQAESGWVDLILLEIQEFMT